MNFNCVLSCGGVRLICRRYLVPVYLFECCFVGEFVESDYGKCSLGVGIGCTVGFV
jgi:hypothetical protein